MKIATEEEVRKKNIACKPKVKGKSVKLYLNFQEEQQHKSLESPDFIPKPIFVNSRTVPYPWIDMMNVVTSTAWKGRYGRQIRFLVRDRNPTGFIYGFVQLNSPTINAKVSDYMKKELELETLDMDQINREMVEMSICVGMGPLARYLSGKMQVYMTLSSYIKNLWDKKYKTDLYIHHFSIRKIFYL